MSEPFSTDLCACGSDCGLCCYGFWCTSCLYGENAAKVHGGDCYGPCCAYYWLAAVSWFVPFACLQGLVGGPTRRTIRERHGLAMEPCSDCCVHYWCSSCAVSQEAKELRVKGVEPTVGMTKVTPGPGPMNAPPPAKMA